MNQTKAAQRSAKQCGRQSKGKAKTNKLVQDNAQYKSQACKTTRRGAQDNAQNKAKTQQRQRARQRARQSQSVQDNVQDNMQYTAKACTRTCKTKQRRTEQRARQSKDKALLRHTNRRNFLTPLNNTIKCLGDLTAGLPEPSNPEIPRPQPCYHAPLTLT